MYDLKLSQQVSPVKLSWAASPFRWLKGEETNVSKTISVLILRYLMWLGIQFVS
jgi:hypothetical protein